MRPPAVCVAIGKRGSSLGNHPPLFHSRLRPADPPFVATLMLCVVIGVIFYGSAYFFEKIKIPIFPRVLRIIGNVLIGLIVVVGAVAGEIATV